jgi:Relaxase/Mobilisation nuclease domain
MTDEPEPLFDIIAYGRGAPSHRRWLSAGEIEHVARTVGRTPEVMVKVINKGAHTPVGIRRHFDYIGRKGDVEIETDDGDRLRGRDIGNALQEEWNLDLIEVRGKTNLTASKPKEPPRLVYKLIFSMAAGTPPEKVKTAVRNFAREEFALKHRYAMALHTDEPHPHVHLVLKATSGEGERLYLRKATLREWRAGFARHLRAVGVAANATPRSVRGVTTPRKSDGIYRASKRGESTHIQERVKTVTRELSDGKLQIEAGKEKLLRTREAVRSGWLGVFDSLSRDGHSEVAAEVTRFVEQMPRPRSEKEHIAAKLLTHRSREPKTAELDLVR